jgi:hypothetical protein
MVRILGDRRGLNMQLIISDNEYKKICVWKDEVPFIPIGQDNIYFHTDGCDDSWYEGTISIEVKLGSRHISNYAMIFMKYVKMKQKKTDVIIHYGENGKFFKSQVLPFNKNISMGLGREYAEAIDEFFKEYPIGKLPNGVIEILGGGYDEIGSSNYSFKKVMGLLVFIFQHIDRLSDDELRQQLLNMM